MTLALATEEVIESTPTPAYLGARFTGGYSDPMLMHGKHFTDRAHRLVINVMGDPRMEIYKTRDFDTFELISDDWIPGLESLGATTFQDYAVTPEGTFLLYQNDGPDKATAVWTGDQHDIDAGTIERVGRVIDNDNDCGVFYDPIEDLVHIYTEDSRTPSGSVSSKRLNHYVTNSTDLLNATYVGIAVDMGSIGTGDPDIFEAAGSYWLVCDSTNNHPTYWLALWRSDDLYNWELVDTEWTSGSGTRGGDFDGILVNGVVYGFTEYSENMDSVGLWKVTLPGEESTGRTQPVSTLIDGNPASIYVA